MKKQRIICGLIVLCLLFACGPCYAYWVWSSETNKWVNPIYKIFNTAEEQFTWAKAYFDEGDYRKAIFEFKKILKKFRTSSLAPEAKFYIADCYEKLGKLKQSYEAYQSVIDTYPMNERLEEIVEKQYLIGEKFFIKRKYEYAKEIFEKVVSNAPYSKVSDVAKYKIGMCYLKMKTYDKARDEFEELVDSYGFSPYVDDASYQIGFCSFKMSSSIKDYDEELIDKAVEDLKYFLRKYPTSTYVPDVQSLLNKMYDKKAEKLFTIAQFYEKQKKIFPAKGYYQDVIYSYGKTSWAKKSSLRLKRLEE